MKKRIVCGAVVLLAALFASPGAQAQFAYTTNNGAITITGYTGSGGTVIIPDEITGLPVTSIGDWAFRSIGVINVTIPDTVTNIGEGVFEFCESLANVTLGTNVASIGEGAFSSCGSLTNLNIPGSVTTIGDYAFDGCVKLTSITIPAGVLNIGDGAFYYCTNLSNLTIPASVTSIGDAAFSGCSSLPSVTIPAGVTNIGEAAFAAAPSVGAPGVSARCGSLKAINVDAQNTFYSSINGVLFDKSASTLLQYGGGISGGYTIPGSVTSIASEAFFGTALTSVTIPGSVTNFGDNAFAFCTSLTNLTIANGVTGIAGDASLYLFQGCSNLTSITIPGSVTNIADDAFAFCRLLSNVYFQGNAPVADSSAFAADPSATAYYLPGTTGWSVFSGNTGLPAVLWNPLIQTGDGGFGVQNGQFGFNITGTANIPIVVEACTNLTGPVWTPLQSLTLTNGSYYFSEPFQPGSSQRYYRIGSR